MDRARWSSRFDSSQRSASRRSLNFSMVTPRAAVSASTTLLTRAPRGHRYAIRQSLGPTRSVSLASERLAAPEIVDRHGGVHEVEEDPAVSHCLDRLRRRFPGAGSFRDIDRPTVGQLDQSKPGIGVDGIHHPSPAPALDCRPMRRCWTGDGSRAGERHPPCSSRKMSSDGRKGFGWIRFEWIERVWLGTEWAPWQNAGGIPEHRHFPSGRLPFGAI